MSRSHHWLACAGLVTWTAGGCVAGSGVERSLNISEIGSMHVSGRAVTLAGLPIREVTSTAGRPPARVDPNGDFEADQNPGRKLRLHGRVKRPGHIQSRHRDRAGRRSRSRQDSDCRPEDRAAPDRVGRLL